MKKPYKIRGKNIKIRVLQQAPFRKLTTLLSSFFVIIFKTINIMILEIYNKNIDIKNNVLYNHKCNL